MLKMVNVCKSYNGQDYALYNVNLHIKQKEFVFLVGPSGAGKSTFIKLLFKEISPESGDIFVNGININELEHDDIPGLRRLLGIVFQDYRLLSDRTVYENVAFAMRVIEAPSSLIRRRVMHVLDLVGLRDKANSKTTELSGGEQQRVAIARAVVNDPKILIADEPTGNLDPETKWDIMRIFQQINDSGATIIMATHDEDIVNNLNKRVIGIDGGRVVRDQKRGGYDYQY